MKKNIMICNVREENFGLRYADGVPAAEKKHYWAESPWNAFRLLLREA